MIPKEKKLVITFSMQDDVIAFDRFCKKNDINSKIIHIPMSLTAGCGLSYEMDLSYSDSIKKIIKDNGLFYEGIYEVEI